MTKYIHSLGALFVAALLAGTAYSATAIARVDLLDANGHATGIGILVPLEASDAKGKLLTDVRDIVSSKTKDSSGRLLNVKTTRFEEGWAWASTPKDGKWSVSVTRTVVDGFSKIDGDELPRYHTQCYRIDGLGLGDQRTSGGTAESLRFRVESVE